MIVHPPAVNAHTLKNNLQEMLKAVSGKISTPIRGVSELQRMREGLNEQQPSHLNTSRSLKPTLPLVTRSVEPPKPKERFVYLRSFSSRDHVQAYRARPFSMVEPSTVPNIVAEPPIKRPHVVVHASAANSVTLLPMSLPVYEEFF